MKEQVLRYLDDAGLAYRVIEHAAVHRVGEEPPELDGIPTTKNLLLRDRSTKQVYMMVMVGENRLDLGALASMLGTTKNKLQFVKYDEVESVVGVPPGHVSVFNVLNELQEDVQIVFDAALLDMSEIGFHPNVNTATIVMKPADVLAFLRLHGHEPQIVRLAS